jgi:glycosyltransferase involved in cell wall biosynthesis/tetratricopeptide (TPR) repeat protein
LPVPAPSFTPPASRNAPCPCGSGRRYKDCHGELAAQPSAASNDALPHLLHSALIAQQAGRLAEAIARYDQVLLDAPYQFDALHMQGVAHFQRGEFERALQLIERALVQRPGDASARFNRALVVNALARRPAEAELEREAAVFATAMRGDAHTRDDHAVRVIAFYLPQFHRIAENDAWWGEGFTEWTNVRKALPNFAGHEQPHRPGELGYYDLTDPAVREAQAQLARTHGVDAFCYYHYWFGGRRLLEQPLDAVVASGKPDFPFCVCWANENWTRRWDGLDHEILMQQRYSLDDARAFIASLLPLLRDRRYVRIDGRPLLLVYKLADLPDIAGTVAVWRKVCVDAGIGDPYLAAVQRNARDDPTTFGFDAAVEFPPIGHAAESIVSRLPDLDPAFRGNVFGYANLAADYLLRPRPAFRTFRSVTPMWDNTARRQQDGMIVAGTSPELFGAWTTHALEQTRTRHEGESRLLFVNAWNEWAEGNHLEPDAVHGRRYLEALRTARGLASRSRPTRPHFADVERDTREAVATGALRVEHLGALAASKSVRVSIVMPAFNHARFLPQALASLAAQTHTPDELIAVDDGSSDESAALIASWARSAPFAVTLVRQANAGAHVALNRGMAIARGEIIALMNSDDAFAPGRLARLLEALDTDHALAFSGVALVDEASQPSVTAYAQELAARVAEVSALPNLLYALIRHNAAVSTGNLVFRRKLLADVGGFAALRVCHDWDFVLAATYATRIAVVSDPLYVYRLHGANTFSGLTLAGRLESDWVLEGFFARLREHPWLDANDRERLRRFAREAGLGGYL